MGERVMALIRFARHRHRNLTAAVVHCIAGEGIAFSRAVHLRRKLQVSGKSQGLPPTNARLPQHRSLPRVRPSPGVRVLDLANSRHPRGLSSFVYARHRSLLLDLDLARDLAIRPTRAASHRRLTPTRQPSL